MTKGNKWFVTRKPSSEFQLYDFARSARYVGVYSRW